MADKSQLKAALVYSNRENERLRTQLAELREAAQGVVDVAEWSVPTQVAALNALRAVLARTEGGGEESLRRGIENVPNIPTQT